MPNRILKESVKTSAQIDQLSWFEEVVFYRLVVTADDYGCLDGRTILLRNELFPTKDNVTRKAIEEAIAKLVSVGLLHSYVVSGMPYLCFPTWDKHQRIRNKHRKFPEPPPADVCQSNDGQMTANCQSESESNPIRIQSESNSREAHVGGDAVDLSKFGDELQQAVENWLSYKKEKRQSYKPTALKALISQIRNSAGEYGEQAVTTVILQSISNGYQGIVWDWLKKTPKGSNRDIPKVYTEAMPF